MTTFRLLETGNEPLLKVGQHVFFKGNTWDSALAGKMFKIVKRATTHYRKDFGIFATSGTNGEETWTVDDEIRPDYRDSLFQIRMEMVGAAHLFVKFPTGHIRGGLEKGTYATPDPDSETMRFLGHFTEKDLENHRMEFFEAYGNGPNFEIENFVVDSKVILDMIFNEIKIVEDSGYKGEADAVLEDPKEMGDW